MGGKGGGGGSVAPYQTWVDVLAQSPIQKQKYEGNRSKYASEADWYAAYGGPDPAPMPMSANMSKDIFTKIYGTYTPPPAPAPAPVAAPAPAPAAPAPAPPDPGPVQPLGPAIDPGGAIDQPGNSTAMGDELGGAVLNPPKYWVGGVDQYELPTAAAGRGAGAIKTTV